MLLLRGARGIHVFAAGVLEQARQLRAGALHPVVAGVPGGCRVARGHGSDLQRGSITQLDGFFFAPQLALITVDAHNPGAGHVQFSCRGRAQALLNSDFTLCLLQLGQVLHGRSHSKLAAALSQRLLQLAERFQARAQCRVLGALLGTAGSLQLRADGRVGGLRLCPLLFQLPAFRSVCLRALRGLRHRGSGALRRLRRSGVFGDEPRAARGFCLGAIDSLRRARNSRFLRRHLLLRCACLGQLGIALLAVLYRGRELRLCLGLRLLGGFVAFDHAVELAHRGERLSVPLFGLVPCFDGRLILARRPLLLGGVVGGVFSLDAAKQLGVLRHRFSPGFFLQGGSERGDTDGRNAFVTVFLADKECANQRAVHVLIQDAGELVVRLRAGPLALAWGEHVQLGGLLAQPPLMNAEAVRAHCGLHGDFRGLVPPHWLQRLDLFRLRGVLLRENDVNGLHHRGLAGLILALDDHHAGLREVLQQQVLDAADVSQLNRMQLHHYLGSLRGQAE